MYEKKFKKLSKVVVFTHERYEQLHNSRLPGQKRSSKLTSKLEKALDVLFYGLWYLPQVKVAQDSNNYQ